MGQNRHIDGQVVREGAHGFRTDGQIVHHHAVYSRIDATLRQIKHPRQAVSNIDGVKGVLPCFFIHLFLDFHIGLNPFHRIVITHVRDQFVVLDYIAAAQRRLPKELRADFQRITAARLDHIVEQRAAFFNAKYFPPAVRSKFRAVILVQCGFGDSEVQQFEVGHHGNIPNRCGQHHRQLIFDIGRRKCNLQDILPAGNFRRQSVFIVRRLIDANHFSDMTGTNFRCLAGNRHPGTGGLFDGQYLPQNRHIPTFISLNPVCGDYVIFHINAFRQGNGFVSEGVYFFF